MANLKKSTGGEKLLEMANSSHEIFFSLELQPLIKQLDEHFGNEKICRFVV